MKYIQNIDDAICTRIRGHFDSTDVNRAIKFDSVVAKPEEGFGMLKWKIRIIKAIAVLKGKADAFTYSKQY